MVLQSSREYLDAIGKRYRKVTRNEQSIILGEFCATCGYNRKYAIRLLRKKLLSDPNRKPGLVSIYAKEQQRENGLITQKNNAKLFQQEDEAFAVSSAVDFSLPLFVQKQAGEAVFKFQTISEMAKNISFHEEVASAE